MKKACLLVFLLFVMHSGTMGQTYSPAAENLEARKKFSENRFGIFLHWGIYSLFGQGEWYMTNKDIDCREYAKVANAFYPHGFDAGEWVSVIKSAGAKYVCFTSRHHDGFSMWDTKASDYNIMNTPYGHDVIKDLAEECHRQGIGLHLYYSHIDWTRPDYPRGRTGQKTCKDLKPDWSGYYRFMNKQLTELLTNYGPVNAIWFDGWWDHDQDSIPFDWQLEEQYALIHSLQPACLVGNNHHQETFPGEDIQIFERDVPGENKAGLSGQAVGRLPLETCQTMNGMWGYKVEDQNYKSAEELIRLLVRTAGKGANLLLNIGPQPDGLLPDTALKRLEEMGKWLKVYGESIYGTEAGGIGQGDSIVTTRKGDKIYVHLLDTTIKELCLPLGRKVRSVTSMADNTPLAFKQENGKIRLSANIPQHTIDYIIIIHLQNPPSKTQ